MYSMNGKKIHARGSVRYNYGVNNPLLGGGGGVRYRRFHCTYYISILSRLKWEACQ